MARVCERSWRWLAFTEGVLHASVDTHLSSHGNAVNRAPRWTFSGQKAWRLALDRPAPLGPWSASGVPAECCSCLRVFLTSTSSGPSSWNSLGRPPEPVVVFVSFLLVFRPLSSCSAPWKGSSGLFFIFATITLYISESSLFCYVLSLGCNLYVCCDCLSYFPGCYTCFSFSSCMHSSLPRLFFLSIWHLSFLALAPQMSSHPSKKLLFSLTADWKLRM